MSSRTAWSTELFQGKDIYGEAVSKSQKLKVKIKEIEVKIKLHKDGKCTQILDTIMLSLNCLNAEKGATAAKRLLFINAAELTQDRYFENTLASKLKSKGMLLWRRDFAFFPQKTRGSGFIQS